MNYVIKRIKFGYKPKEAIGGVEWKIIKMEYY